MRPAIMYFIMHIIVLFLSLLINSSYENSILKQTEMQENCWSIISSLPIHDWDDRLFSYLFNRSTIRTKQMGVVFEYLIHQCMLRYQALLKQTITNNKLLKLNSTAKNKLKSSINRDKHSLITFDMDETLLDQRVEQRPRIPIPSSQHWKRYHTIAANKHNTHDLLFGITKIPDVKPDYAQLIIFRMYLMQFIEQCQQSSSFIIYSMATSEWVIRNVVLIEMYYNYVHQFRSVSHNSEITPFKFDHVITRLYDEHHRIIEMKSLSIMMKLIDMEQFDKIFIVDDMASNVWKEEIPPMLKNISSKIFPFVPPAFEIHMEVVGSVANDAFLLSRSKRLDDVYFHKLMKFVAQSDNMSVQHSDGQLGWIPYSYLRHAFTYVTM
eukprot:309431_1